MNRKIKRQIQMVGLKIARILDPQKMQREDRKDFNCETFSICKRLIAQEESTLLISPISGKRYIKSDDKQLYVIIEPNTVTIVNHAYSYTIAMDSPAFQRLVKVFDFEVERRREEMEAEIKSNVKHSLTQIYQNLVHEQV